MLDKGVKHATVNKVRVKYYLFCPCRCHRVADGYPHEHDCCDPNTNKVRSLLW